MTKTAAPGKSSPAGKTKRTDRRTAPAGQREISSGGAADEASPDAGPRLAGSAAGTVQLERHPLERQVLRQFRVIVQAVRSHYQDVAQSAGVSGSQLWALACIAAQPNLRAGELAATMALHQATASNLLRRLEGAGLIRRERHKADQRVVHLVLTEQGESVLANAPRPIIGALQDGLGKVSAPTLRGLQQHLAALIAAMGIDAEKGANIPLSDM